MTVTNATPRPWEVSSYAFGDYVQAPDGTEIAKTIEKSASLPDLEREANAALIVTAVNAHDALTQMLRRVVFAYFDNANGRYDLPEAMEDAAKLLDIRLGNCVECGDWAIVSDPGLCERCEALS